MNENTYISIPVSTLDELAAVGRAMVSLTERLRRVAQPGGEGVFSAPPLSDAAFERMRAKSRKDVVAMNTAMQKNFTASGMTEEAFDVLVEDAITAVREKHPHR